MPTPERRLKPRAFRRLAGMDERALLASLAEGLSLIAEHIQKLERDASSASPRSVAAIRVISDDEAGKYLVLLDGLRCARREGKVTSEQMRRAGDHLAKGIYSRVADMRPADFAEVVRYCDSLRQQYYLDGPIDTDWIFRNEVDAHREERLYVDLIADDDGSIRWHTPEFWDDTTGMFANDPSGAVQLAGALHRSGFDTEAGLRVIADIWENFEPKLETETTKATHWQEVVPLIEETIRGIAEANDHVPGDEDLRKIYDGWSFPLWSADLRLIEGDLKTLRERQENWHPDI
jgi:hypothetical protein